MFVLYFGISTVIECFFLLLFWDCVDDDVVGNKVSFHLFIFFDNIALEIESFRLLSLFNDLTNIS